MITLSRRGFMAGTLSATMLGGFRPAFGQTFPSERFTLVCGYSPGGLADITSRLVGNYLTGAYPEPAIVENKPGANGALGWRYLAGQKPDGYNLLMSTQAQVVMLPATTPSLGFDPVGGLTHITSLVEAPYLLFTNTEFEAQSFEDLVKLGRERKKAIFYGTSGVGGQQHLASEFLAQQTGIVLKPSHYKGGGEMMVDLLSNRIQLAFATSALAAASYKDGKIKPLLILGDDEDPTYPGVPSSTEVGLPAMKAFLGWYGVDAPPGVPDEIADALNGIIADCAKSPEFEAAAKEYELRIITTSRQEYADRISREYAEMQKLAKAIGLQG